MMENSVVMPAPWGPISAVIRPASTASETLSTARRPPKRLNTRSTRSSGSAMSALQDRRPQTRKTPTQIGQQTRNPVRGKGYDQYEHAAVDDEVEAGRIAGDELGQFAERLDDHRAKQRPEHGADAADDGREQGLDGNPGPIRDTGVDEEKILHVETSAGGGDGGGNCHSDELDPHCVDADRFGSVLIFTHSDKPGAEPALLDQAHDDERNGKERKHDPIERRAALELERLRPQIERNQDADAGTGDGCDAGENAQHLGKRQRDEGEIRALQSGTEGERADCGADQRAAGDPERERGPGVDAVAHWQDGSDIRAGHEEGRMTEGILPAIATEHVPRSEERRVGKECRSRWSPYH